MIIMATGMMRIKKYQLLFLFLPLRSFCQNLLANGGFEDLNVCTEYSATCSPAAWFVVGIPIFKNPGAKDGSRVMALCYDNVYSPVRSRTFPNTRILCPLAAGKEYILSCWLYPGPFPFSHLDVLLTPNDPARLRLVQGKIKPSFILTGSDILRKDKDGWILLSKRFTPASPADSLTAPRSSGAQGHQPMDAKLNFILLGNLSLGDTYSHRLEKKAEKDYGNIIYLMDDIRLVAADPALNTCLVYEANREKLYAEHRRHTRHVYLDSLADPSSPPALSSVSRPPPPALTSSPGPGEADTIVIPGLLFETNSSVINKSYALLLDSIFLKMGKTAPAKKTPAKIEIDGHTDNTGSLSFNKKLSLERAQRVRDYLAERAPQWAPFMTVIGYGMNHPVAPNDDPAGKARNRRVEVIFFY
jgi:outer membrane protein OmpA-like peptidoglycan-associated protein